ncbi:MAG TPA: hypothetical protein VEC38_00720, partial [Candidatus Binataceae bacterium]|nr:hypothetical protein [Candidatus Binataceae bacterium]
MNAAQVNSGPVTTYTYDPSGVPTLSGNANNWPFLFEGAEHEITDPASLYYDGSGNFYDPQIQRELAQLDATGLSQPNLGSVGGTAGANGGSGSARRGTGSVSGPRAANSAYRSAQEGDEGEGEGGCDGCYSPSGGDLLIQILDWLGQLLNDIFGDLFSGGSSPPVLRQLLHQRHPLYVQILGIQPGLVPTEASTGGGLLAKDDSSQTVSTPLLVLGQALELGASVEVAGGGPEDPVADVVAASIIVTGAVVATYEAYQAYAKGGKQNISDSGLAGLSDEEVMTRARSP